MSEFLYLDYNATTPVDPRVTEAMVSALRDNYGNPSSGHALGRRARAAVDGARAHVAAMIGASPEEILFTSGGTEANNSVILGVARDAAEDRRHLVISAVEHPATIEPARRIEARGWRVTRLPVDRLGRVNPDELAPLLDSGPRPALVSVMLANNEVGTLQPVAELAALCREHDLPLHSDAAQAVGKIPVNVAELGVDYLSIAGHKFYGPKGVGALYVRRGRELPPFLLGASQEGGRRAGTENVPEIVGLGEAARLVSEGLDGEIAHSRRLRDTLLAGLRARFDDAAMRVNGCAESGPELCLPGTLSVSFRGIVAGELLEALGDRLAASAGAACNTAAGGDVKPSTTLAAMGVPLEWAAGTLRLSVGRMADEGQVDRAVALLAEEIGARLR